VSGVVASRFAKEAEEEFESVLWPPCHGRTLAQESGELGRQVVLDSATAEISRELTAGGRTSTAISRDVVQVIETPETLSYARHLISTQRYAEAYELLYRLLDAVVEPEHCARELTWICERWGRVNEAKVLRFDRPSEDATQMALF
jgi:hypothetical protein